MSVDEVVDETDADGRVTRTVRGTVTVPNYLTTPQDGASAEQLAAAEDAYRQLPAELRDADPFLGDALGLAGDVPVVTPQSRFVYASPTPGPMDTPVQNPLVPTTEAEFTCKLPVGVDGGAKPTLYGHGLLGGRGEVEGGSTRDLRSIGHAMCGVDWIGMSTEDITNVGLILHDISFFPSLADRAQQGFLNFLYVGRALIHPEGAVAQAAFQGRRRRAAARHRRALLQRQLPGRDHGRRADRAGARLHQVRARRARHELLHPAEPLGRLGGRLRRPGGAGHPGLRVVQLQRLPGQGRPAAGVRPPADAVGPRPRPTATPTT